MKGRVENYNPRFLTLLDECMGNGPSMMELDPHPGPPRSLAIPVPSNNNAQPSLGGTPTGSPR